MLLNKTFFLGDCSKQLWKLPEYGASAPRVLPLQPPNTGFLTVMQL